MKTKNNPLPLPSPEELEQIRREGIEAIATFAASFTGSAIKQFLYDLETNVPKRILTVEEVKLAEHAIRSGVASAVNAWGHWDCQNAVRVASEILEDANCHTVNGALLDAAKKDGISPYEEETTA